MLIFVCIFFVLFPLLSYAKTAKEIAQNSFPSVVMLVMEDKNGQMLSLGSGFIVKKGVVVTNLHVIKGATKGYAKLIRQKSKYDIAGIVGIDSERDLVILSVPNVKAPSLQLGDSSQVAVGDEIYAVGNPQGLEGTFSQGIVSSVRQIGSEQILQITAPISPGSSGGPILNSQGKVIGVAVATFKGGQNLNFAIPVSYLSALLADMKPAVPLSSKKEDKTDGSILTDLGGHSAEGVIGEAFAWGTCCDGRFTFSLRNQLRESVKNIRCLVVIYDDSDRPIDFASIHYPNIIPDGLAKRIFGHVDSSVEAMLHSSGFINKTGKEKGRIEFRILDFQIIE